MARELGDKLGPRLASLVREHTLATRRALAPIEAQIAAAGAQHLIDRAGLEVAGLWRPLISSVLAAAPAIDPMAREFLEQTASGDHQWQAIAGVLGVTGVTGGLGTVLTNYLAPGVQATVALSPNLHADQNAAAQAAARGILSGPDADALGAQAGYDPANMNLLYSLAQAIPGAADLYDLANRGLIRREDVIYWLMRAGIPPELRQPFSELARVLLTPADAALAVLRGILAEDEGRAIAAAGGVTAADFDVLVGNTGEPLALEEMLLLFRWGRMDRATLERGIRQSRVRDEWIPYAEQLGTVPPSGAEIINALVRGQIPEAEARSRWFISGGDPTWFDTAFTSNARPPSPEQLASMAHRGIIPWHGTGPNVISFEQGIFEGDLKDKWEPALEAAAVYHPPPREISTLVREGGLTQDQALAYWKQAGLSDDLAAIYWQAAHYTRTSAIHQLAQSEITRLYEDKAITRDEARAMLEADNWTADDAEWLLDIADLGVARKQLDAAVAKIRALFIAWKIDGTAAAAALASLEIDSSTAQLYLAVWGLERDANVKVLTSSEITDAWFYGIVPDPATAQGMLQQIGYTAHDAWVLLNVKNKGLITDYPDPGGQ